MERNYMSNSFSDNGIIRSRSYNHSPSKVKDYSWSQTHLGFGEGDHHPGQDSLGPGSGVFSWPPRSYTCSFCKREFRSAQALGGHMNVHRRDRARLRQSSPLMDNNNNVGQFTTSSHPPPLNLNLRPNHFSLNPSDDDNDGDDVENAVSPPTKCTEFSSSGAPLLLVEGALLLDPLSPRDADFVKKGARKSFFRPESLAGFKLQDGRKFLKKEDIVRLDLEIGVLGDHTKEEPDLELRLGC